MVSAWILVGCFRCMAWHASSSSGQRPRSANVDAKPGAGSSCFSAAPATTASPFAMVPFRVQEMKITLPIHGRGAADPARRECGAVGEAAREGRGGGFGVEVHGKREVLDILLAHESQPKYSVLVKHGSYCKAILDRGVYLKAVIGLKSSHESQPKHAVLVKHGLFTDRGGYPKAVIGLPSLKFVFCICSNTFVFNRLLILVLMPPLPSLTARPQQPLCFDRVARPIVIVRLSPISPHLQKEVATLGSGWGRGAFEVEVVTSSTGRHVRESEGVGRGGARGRRVVVRMSIVCYIAPTSHD
jgi:hypothetical protein